MAEHFSQQDLGDFLSRLQQAALTGYENPERKGCPGFHTLRDVAGASAPFAHPAYEHIKTCSPCLREMLGIQSGVIQRRRRKKKTTLVGCLAVGALLVLCGMIFVFRNGNPSNQQLAMTAIAEVVRLDLRSSATQRGANDADGPAAHVARNLDTLDITLPFGSDDGTYSVEIRDGKNDSLIKTATGVARLFDGGTQLIVRGIDLSAVPPGEYRLLFRHADASWNKAKISVQ